MVLHTDGSWQPVLDKMGGGGVIRDSHGRWIFGFAMMMGAGNAFTAELRAVERGPRHAWELGFRNVRCCVDCLEAQRVLTTGVDVQDFWNRDEILATRELLSRAWNVSLVYVPRERNGVADAMAKLAIEDNWTWKEWKIPPAAVVPLLCQDVVF